MKMELERHTTRPSHSWLRTPFGSTQIWIVLLREIPGWRQGFDRCVNVPLFPKLWSLHHSHKPRHHLFMCLGSTRIHGGKRVRRHATRLTQSQRGEGSEHTHTHTCHTQVPHSYCAHTLRLAELVEDHEVVGVVEVFGQRVDVLTGQPVGHEDRRPVSVCPVDTILKHTENNCLNRSNTQNKLVRVWTQEHFLANS